MALRLFEERPLYITFFTASTFVKRVENEISRSFGPDTEHLRDLVRYLSCHPFESIMNWDTPKGRRTEVSAKGLSYRQRVLCIHGNVCGCLPEDCWRTTCHLFSYWERDRSKNASGCPHYGRRLCIFSPNVTYTELSLQFLCTPALKAARKISKKPVKIYAWISSQTTFTIYQNAPERWGGIGDLLPKVMEEVNSNGRPLREVANEVRSQMPLPMKMIPDPFAC